MKPSAIFWSLVLAGCTATDPASLDGGDKVPLVPPVPDNCPAIFAQDLFPEYHLDISVDEWAKLEDEFLHTRERTASGLDPTPYHPAGFRYVEDGQTVAEVPGVLVRLKGNSSWLETIDHDADPKMQFTVAFNEVDSDGRFMGLRKLDLDMPRTDLTFLQQRLSLFYMRAAGIEAPCANNARLVINGVYYGLYLNLERQDKEYLQRVFPGEAKGDLWKGGRILKTNEDNFSWDRLDAFWNAGNDLAALEELADLPAALREWAAEAMVGDADGYQTGHPNYLLYDHPTRGFVWLPNDLDTSSNQDYLAAESSPTFSPAADRLEEDWSHYLLVMNDPTWFERYVEALTFARSHYDAEELSDRVEAWAKQISASAEQDPRRPFTMAEHHLALDRMRGFIGARAAFIDRWLGCRAHGGADEDGDGFDFCNDCNDDDANINPDAAELCNGVDDDCDGRADDASVPGGCA